MTPLRQRFLHDLQLCNYSPRTVETYVRHVAHFARHFGQSPERLDAEHVRPYQLHLLKRQASGSACNQAVCALRFLYRVTLQRPGLVAMLPYGKKPKALPAVLSPDEVRHLCAAAGASTFRLLLETTYACGLRASEVLHLKGTDLDSQRLLVHVRHGKGGKDRLVPLSPALLERRRRSWRQHRPKGWLFPGRTKAGHWSLGQVQRLMQRAVRAAGISKQASLHTLRHSYATHLLEAGVDLPTLRQLLGHNQISTTLLYTHVQQSHLPGCGSPLDTLLARLDGPAGPTAGQEAPAPPCRDTPPHRPA
jgi:site-specific recombinase XerD